MSFIGRILPAGGKGSTSPRDERQARQDAVDKLCNRLANAALLEDRRAAAQSLKSVAKHYQVEVGATALPALLKALKRDAEDSELCKNIVEAFIAICAEDVEMRREFGEILLKDAEMLPILLEGVIVDGTQYVRFTIVQLLVLLQELLPTQLAAAILQCPSGLSNLLGLLRDERDIIRIEALVLVRRLAATSQEIQKISVFDGTLETLFDLITDEGGVFGGEPIVQEALQVVQSLLQHNPANQKYFVESVCFSRLPQLLVPASGGPVISYTEQKVINFGHVVELVLILMHHDNPHLEGIQTAFCRAQLFDMLARYAFDGRVPGAVQIAALRGLSRLIWRNAQGHHLLAKCVVTTSTTTAAADRPQPAILAVIRTCVEGGSPGELPIRLAAAELISSYLFENPDGQLVIAATFKSPRLSSGSPTMDEQSAGSAIIERTLDLTGVRRDPFRVWFPCLLLSYVLRDNSQCKLLALQHTVLDSDAAEDQGGDGGGLVRISFFSQLLENLCKTSLDSRQTDSAAGYLVLLCTWISDHLPSVRQFLSEGSNVQLLIELIHQNSTADPILQGYAAFAFGLLTLFDDVSEGPFTRKSLQDIITSRIGFDVFSARIIRTRDHLHTALVAELGGLQGEAHVFDKIFAEFYLEYCGIILQLFSAKSSSASLLHQHRPLSQLASATSLRLEKSVETEDLVPLSDNVALFELQAQEGGGQLAAENERLRRTIAAYSEQLLQLEKEHEELLICLASYDSELKQLRQHLAIAEERRESSTVFENSNPSDIDITASVPWQHRLQDHPAPAPVASGSSLQPGALYSSETASPSWVPPDQRHPEQPQLPPSSPSTPIKARIVNLLHSEAPSTSTHDV